MRFYVGCTFKLRGKIEEKEPHMTRPREVANSGQSKPSGHFKRLWLQAMLLVGTKVGHHACGALLQTNLRLDVRSCR